MNNEKDNENILRGNVNFNLPCHMNYGKLFLDRISGFGNRMAMVDGITDEKITFREMAYEIVKIASSLTQAGVRRGEVVAICSENRIEVLPTTLAVLCTGAVVTFINISNCKDEVIHIANISKPKYLILSPKAFQLHFKTLKKLNFIERYFNYGNDIIDLGVTPLKDLEETPVDLKGYEPTHFYGQSCTALILYSSGTTGLPKGVKLSHLNCISASYQAQFTDRLLTMLTVATFANTLGLLMITDALFSGKTVVFLSKFTEDSYLQIIEKYKVGLLLAPPPIIVLLSKSSLLHKYNLDSVKVVTSGGASLEADTINEFKSRFPKLLHLLQGYGMTETTGATTKESETAYKLGSVGKVVAGIILKVVDVKTGKTLGPMQRGEVYVKGPVLFEGYIGMDEVTDGEGYYKSGDIAYYDDEGFVYIVDRIKELIKYKAWQVPPSELEGVLLQHPCVKDAAVVGRPDKSAGELPTAFVVIKPNKPVTKQEIVKFVTSKVSPWKQLRGGVMFVEEIPKNASGKILRRILRELLIKPAASKL